MGGERVQAEVGARHLQAHGDARARTTDGREHLAVGWAPLGGREVVDHPGIGVATAPVGDHPSAVRPNPVGERGRARVVSAGDEHAVTLHPGGELVERGVVGRRIVAVVLQVVRVHVGDHGDRGVQMQEGAVGLVRLDHEDLAFAGMGVGAEAGHDGADEVGGIQAGADQGRRQHRAGARLAMGTRDGNLPRAGREHRGRRRAMQDAEPAPQSLRDLRDVLGVGGADHDGVGVVDVRRIVAEVTGDAEVAQRLDHRRLPDVAAGDGNAALEGDPRDRRHRRAADPHDEDPAEFLQRRQSIRWFDDHRRTPPARSTRSASRAAASAGIRLRATPAIAASRSWSRTSG